MRLTNKSSYPTEEIRSLVEFAVRGVNTTGVAIHVRNHYRAAYSGRAYKEVPHCSPRSKQSSVQYLITLKIGCPERFPVSNWIAEKWHAYGGKRSPRIEMQCWREGLIALAAHEARHIQQFRLGKPVSEVDCERFADQKLKSYRKLLEGATEAERERALQVYR